jgi:armadillo repeat-containing protein 6
LTINESSGKPVLNETIEKLKDHVENTTILSQDELDKLLDTLSEELAKSVPHRVLAAKNKAYDYLLKVIDAEIEKNAESHLANSVSHNKK